VQKDSSKAADHSYCNIQLFISTFILAVQFENSWVKKLSEFTYNFNGHKNMKNDVETFKKMTIPSRLMLGGK